MSVTTSIRVGRTRPARSFAPGLAALVAVALLVVPRAAPASPALAQLRGIEELKSWFNTFKNHPRLILLLSPT